MHHPPTTTSPKMADNTTTGTTRLKTLLEDDLDVEKTLVESTGAISIPNSRKALTSTAPATTLTPAPNVVVTPPTAAPEPASEPAPELYPILIDGQPPSKSTGTLKKLELLPILHQVILRPKKTLKRTEKRMSYEEGWVSTQRGNIAEQFCNECSKGCGPFTLCCVVEGKLVFERSFNISAILG